MAAGPQNPNQAIDVMGPITVTHVILMAALALAAIAAIWYGAILRRRRAAAQEQVDENFETAREHGATHEPTAVSIDATPTLSDDVPEADVGVATAPVATPIASDLTQIKGLGPKLATTLAELGITRVEQIAALTPAEASDLDAKLGTFQGRMTRDRWVEQAKLLSTGDRAGYEAAFGKLGG